MLRARLNDHCCSAVPKPCSMAILPRWFYILHSIIFHVSYTYFGQLQFMFFVGLRAMVNTLLRSLKLLSDVLVLFLFFLGVMALIGLQLFSGELRSKCVFNVPDNSSMSLQERALNESKKRISYRFTFENIVSIYSLYWTWFKNWNSWNIL